MSNRHVAEGRVIHPRALTELGEEACIVALGVARDLRSGVIPPEHYSQWTYGSGCGTHCCIAGHIYYRLGRYGSVYYDFVDPLCSESTALDSLFGCVRQPEHPAIAADAIERYVYDGSDAPWSTT